MGKIAIRCCGKLNEKPCSNILAYIQADGKITTARHGRSVEISTKENGGSVTITCERSRKIKKFPKMCKNLGKILLTKKINVDNI